MSDIRSSQGDLFNWQKPLSELDSDLWDVLVVGAGPAGSTAAYHLSQSGHRVLLADTAKFPRQKICGDCMITDLETNLDSLGIREAVREAGTEVDGITIYSASGLDFEIEGRFVTLKRPVLDSIVARRAVDAGVTFVHGHVSGLSIDEDGSVTAGFRKYDRSIRARLAIVATGANIGLARKLKAISQTRPSALAMRCYVRTDLRLDRLILSYSDFLLPGYGWIVPLGDGEFNVGCGHFNEGDNHDRLNIRDCFEVFTSQFEPARELMKNAEITAPLRAGALRCDLSRSQVLIKRSVVLIGETIGTTFPLTGEGIGQAMTTGRMAATAIDEAIKQGNRELLGDYERQLKSEIQPRHDGFRHAQKWIARPWLNDLMARRITKSKYLRDACTDFVTRSGDPRKLYSVRAVLRSFFE